MSSKTHKYLNKIHENYTEKTKQADNELRGLQEGHNSTYNKANYEKKQGEPKPTLKKRYDRKDRD